MNWDSYALFVLAASGLLSLVLTQVRDLLIRVKEIIDAWRAVQRSARTSDSRHEDDGLFVEEGRE